MDELRLHIAPKLMGGDGLSALHSLGFISDELLDSYGQNGSPLMAHISHKVNTVEFSTGSLGHGLPFAVGKAIASQNKQKNIYLMY